MGFNTNMSFGISVVFSVLIFSGLQMYRNSLGSTRFLTLVAGYVSSWLFIFVLTAFNNLESMLFYKGFESQIFPEVILSMFVACFAAAMVHRVSVTVCILCSILALYYLNKLGQSDHSPAHAHSAVTNKKRK